MKPDARITYRYLLSKAWPIILANAAVPLLGLADTAVIGNFGSVADLGAIAFGALIFSFVYWSFGFLRMGTTGFAAQAAGAGDELEVRAVLGRALVMAAALGTLLILLQWPIARLAFAFFVNQSAGFGDVVLAANHILLQLVSFAAFFLDGYAFVAESLVGKAKGARQRAHFDLAVLRSSVLALVSAIALALLVLGGGDIAVMALTDLPAVRSAASEMTWLAALYVLLSVGAFQLDGIFIGVSHTRAMRNAAFLSLACFLLVWWLLIDALGVTGLWLAMIAYVVARALALLLYFPSLRRELV